MAKITSTKKVTVKQIAVELRKQNGVRFSEKVRALWYFVCNYLELLRYTGATIDVEFNRRLKQMLDLVYEKIDIRKSGDILDEYVVYELKN